MLQRFLLTLMSSWVVSPLGVLVAQWFGVANSYEVILVLLASGACVPFQLFMNECMAASGAERGAASLSLVQIALVIFIQTVACAGVILNLTTHDFSTVQVVLTVVALGGNTLISYLASSIYFGLVSQKNVPLYAAVVVGVLPGMVSLLLYIIYILASIGFAHFAGILIISTVILPSIIQVTYLRCLRGKSAAPGVLLDAKQPVVDTPWLIAALLALSALVAFSTHLRESIAMINVSYIALLLVALNALQSLIITIMRADFLSKRSGFMKKILPYSAVVALIFMSIGLAMGWRYSSVIGLLVVQVATAYFIEVSRKIPIKSLVY